MHPSKKVISSPILDNKIYTLYINRLKQRCPLSLIYSNNNEHIIRIHHASGWIIPLNIGNDNMYTPNYIKQAIIKSDEEI